MSSKVWVQYIYEYFCKVTIFVRGGGGENYSTAKHKPCMYLAELMN